MGTDQEPSIYLACPKCIPKVQSVSHYSGGQMLLERNLIYTTISISKLLASLRKIKIKVKVRLSKPILNPRLRLGFQPSVLIDTKFYASHAWLRFTKLYYHSFL